MRRHLPVRGVASGRVDRGISGLAGVPCAAEQFFGAGQTYSAWQRAHTSRASCRYAWAPAEFDAFIRSETERWSKVFKDSGNIKLD